MRGKQLLSSGNDGNGEGEEGGKGEAPLLTCLLSASQITSRRAGYLSRLSLPKCHLVLGRPHKIVGQ